jgi:hypothetical protein
MFLIPIFVLLGGAVWLAVAKAQSSPPPPTTNPQLIAAQAAQANADIAQGQALGLTTAQIADAWSLGLSPQEYYEDIVQPQLGGQQG